MGRVAGEAKGSRLEEAMPKVWHCFPPHLWPPFLCLGQNPRKAVQMLDIIYVGAALLFLGVAIAYTRGCERL